MDPHSKASNLFHVGRSTLDFGGVLQLKPATASSPHSHVIYHHRPLRNDEAKLSHVPASTIQESNEGRATRAAGHMLDSQEGTFTSQQTPLQSHQHGGSRLWLDADGQTPSGHSQCLGSEGAGSSRY